MTGKRKREFTVSGKTYNALGVYGVTPTEDGCVVKWAHGKEKKFKGVTSQEILFKIDEAKSRTDSD